MIYSCQVIRKHILIDKVYQLQIFEDILLIGKEKSQPKYIVDIILQNKINWNINASGQLMELGIKYKNQIKWFCGKSENLQNIKKLLQNKLFYNSISAFYLSSDIIGSGASCRVMSVTDRWNNEKYAAKCISKEYITKKKTLDRLNRLHNEITILRTIQNHENIVKLIDIYEGEQTYYLLFEYLQGETLHKYVKSNKHIGEDEIRIILSQLLKGINHIHSLNLIHRDIKLENIVFTEQQDISKLKIIDFGLSIKSNISTQFAVCGTPGYIAPEVLRHEEANRNGSQFQFTDKIDLFGIGVILYRMMTKKALFECEKTKELLLLNKKCNFSKEYIRGYSNDLNQILYGLLEVNPTLRLSAEDALQQLNSSQITQEMHGSFTTTKSNQFDSDDYEVEHTVEFVNPPYQFPNKFMKTMLENSLHLNEDILHLSTQKSFQLSFSLGLSQNEQKIDYVIE